MYQFHVLVFPKEFHFLCTSVQQKLPSIQNFSSYYVGHKNYRRPGKILNKKVPVGPSQAWKSTWIKFSGKIVFSTFHIPAIFSHFKKFLPFPAISCNCQQFSAVPVISSQFQSCTIIFGHSSCVQTCSANSSHFLPFH